MPNESLLPEAHDPGGTRTKIPPGVTVSAVFGWQNKCRRYWLSWTWGDTATGRTLAVGMMNPSCADEHAGDRTVSKVYRWAKANGFVRLIVVNSSSYRAADQSQLTRENCGYDERNYDYIIRASKMADMFILGYGQPRSLYAKHLGLEMARLLKRNNVPLYVWELSKDGTPKHPLYLPDNVTAKSWDGPQ